MNRADFQQLADIRLDEARVLLAQGKYDGAYYLAGYGVECALKACIAKRTNQYDFPDKQFAVNVYTHNIQELVKHAGLKAQRDADAAADADLFINWEVATAWSESSRYERKARDEAQRLYDAVADTQHGVLAWVKLHW